MRRKIAEEMKRRTSIKEINYILNNMVSGERVAKDFKKGKLKKGLLEFIEAEYGVIKPTFIENLTDSYTKDRCMDEE